MANYAIISVGDKQYRVVEGETLEVQKYPGKVGDKVELDQVLLTSVDGKVEIGTPVLSTKVYATILEEKKGEKVQVFKYKSKSRYRKLNGARQTYTYLKIDSIGEANKVVADKKVVEKKAAAKAPAKKTTTKKTATKSSK